MSSLQGSRGSPRDIFGCRTGPKGPVSILPGLLTVTIVNFARRAPLQRQLNQGRESDLTVGRNVPVHRSDKGTSDSHFQFCPFIALPALKREGNHVVQRTFALVWHKLYDEASIAFAEPNGASQSALDMLPNVQGRMEALDAESTVRPAARPELWPRVVCDGLFRKTMI